MISAYCSASSLRPRWPRFSWHFDECERVAQPGVDATANQLQCWRARCGTVYAEGSQREALPRHRRRRRIQNPRAGCRAAHPHHRRARRGAPSRGRGLRQGRGRQEHVDAASRGRSARPGASDCDPGRGLQRPLTGAHGRCPGRAVRSRQPQGRAPADQERDRGLLDGLADPGVGGARVRERGARRVAHVARHEGVCSPRRDPRVLRVGSARSADVRSAAGSRADRPVRRFSRARGPRSCS